MGLMSDTSTCVLEFPIRWIKNNGDRSFGLFGGEN
jgi:hypothetical protein